MKRVVTAAFLLALAPAAAEAQSHRAPDDLSLHIQAQNKAPDFNGWSGPKPKVDCSCRHKEGRATLGDTVCILQGSRRVTAQCQMTLNNPVWRVLREGCDEPLS